MFLFPLAPESYLTPNHQMMVDELVNGLSMISSAPPHPTIQWCQASCSLSLSGARCGYPHRALPPRLLLNQRRATCFTPFHAIRSPTATSWTRMLQSIYRSGKNSWSQSTMVSLYTGPWLTSCSSAALVSERQPFYRMSCHLCLAP